MASALEQYIYHTVPIITADGRSFIGTLKGFGQTINVILDESHELVFSTTTGNEQIVLHIIRGILVFPAASCYARRYAAGQCKKPEHVTIEREFEKIKKLDIENWENIRGPRPWEENFHTPVVHIITHKHLHSKATAYLAASFALNLAFNFISYVLIHFFSVFSSFPLVLLFFLFRLINITIREYFV
ncbi:hypothetical protein GQX74_015715 [Glossina fuscipes]|nr:hypothetical protein GQX74_015715 [Glossina fuscipes]